MENTILQQFNFQISDCQPLCFPVIFCFLQIITPQNFYGKAENCLNFKNLVLTFFIVFENKLFRSS